MKPAEIQARLQASREQISRSWHENHFLRNPVGHLKNKIKESAVKTTKNHPILVGSAVVLTGWMIFRKLFSRSSKATPVYISPQAMKKTGTFSLILGGLGSILSFTRPIWAPRLTSWLTDRVSSSTNSESNLPRPNHP